MVDIVLLGTGTPMLHAARCGSGVAVVDGDQWVLIDCGRGVPQRVIEAGLDMSALIAVALTHPHSDHVSDLATLATARWVQGAETPLVVLAPAGPCGRFARTCLDGYEDQAFYGQSGRSSPARPTVAVTEFASTIDPSEVFSTGDWTISSALVDHSPIEAAVGYRVVVGGQAVVVSGDTARCRGIERLAAGADVLIHEAVRSDRASKRLLEWNASARSVGEMADELGLRRVVLTHLLPTPGSPDDERAFLDEARDGGYGGDLVLAHDLMRLTVS